MAMMVLSCILVNLQMEKPKDMVSFTILMPKEIADFALELLQTVCLWKTKRETRKMMYQKSQVNLF